MYSTTDSFVSLFVCVWSRWEANSIFLLLENRLKLPLQLILYSANIRDWMQSNSALGTKWQLLVTEVSVSSLSCSEAFQCFTFFIDLIILLWWESVICAVFLLSPAKVKLKAFYPSQFLCFNLNTSLFCIQLILNIFTCIEVICYLDKKILYFFYFQFVVTFYIPQIQSLQKMQNFSRNKLCLVSQIWQ